MKRREKILGLAVLSIIGLFAAIFVFKGVVLKPLREIDRRTALLREELAKAHAERRAFFDAEDQLKKLAGRTFAGTVDQSSAKSGEMLTRLILESGLRETDFTRLPAGQRSLRGTRNKESGWSVQGEGRFPQVVNLLFLLQESPYLARLEGVTISSTERPGVVKVRFNYLTLVLDPAPEVERADLPPKFAVQSDERKLYDPLIARDILRPYIKRVPPPPAPRPTPPPAPSAPPPPGPETFQVVSLSEWQGRPEVHVRDSTLQKTTVYKIGDALAGGTIAMVDYRALPKPGNPLLKSHSRVIIKVEDEFWAIERGQNLAQKYRLSSDQLPPKLSPL
jgi:hypothetical protein